MRSRALRIEAGSYVFRVVLTDMLPSMRSRVHAICWVAKAMKDISRVSLTVMNVGSEILTHPG